MNLEKKSIKKKRKVDTLFIEVSASNAFENLPKMMLNKIFLYLSIGDLSKICLLNKFFFNLLMNKKQLSSKIIWKANYERIYDRSTSEEELVYNLGQLENEYELNLNLYCLAIKYYLKFENVDDEKKIIHQREGKKNIFTYKGIKKINRKI